jgi:AraC-like DNA-binding protein
MNSAQMFYREVAPSAKIGRAVLSFWEFTVKGETSEPLEHEVFPDGCVNLLFYRNDKTGTRQNLVVGIGLQSVALDVFAGDVCWGMRISPVAARALFGVNPLEIASQPIEFLPNAPENLREMFNRLNGCESFAEAIRVFESFVETIDASNSEIDARLEKALQILLESSGRIKISELAALINLSRRQLERNFRRASGLTLKQFARICRLRAAAVNLVEAANLNWATRAAECGFADQAHLTREFSRLTGRAPNSFAATVERIEHGDLIK